MHIQCEHAITAEIQNGVVLDAVSASHIVIAVYYVVIVGKASTQQDGTQEHTLFQILPGCSFGGIYKSYPVPHWQLPKSCKGYAPIRQSLPRNQNS